MIDALRVIAAKPEAVYATDAGPTLADDAILTRNYQTTPLEVDQVQRNLDNARYGAQPGKPSNARHRSSYEVEIAGSGAAGTAPAWMKLLQACGMLAPVIVPATSAAQAFAQPGAAIGSLTEYSWTSDQLRKSIGQRGTFRADLTAGSIPYFGFEMTGLVPPVDPREVDAPGAADFTDWAEPIEVNDENSLLTLGGFAAITRSIVITIGKQVQLRNLIGSRTVRAGNHNATARIVCEAPSIATKDYLANLAAGDLIPLAVTHGTVAGNIVEFAAPKLQITAISESEEDDVLMFNIDAALTNAGGVNDLTITAK